LLSRLLTDSGRPISAIAYARTPRQAIRILLYRNSSFCKLIVRLL